MSDVTMTSEDRAESSITSSVSNTELRHMSVKQRFTAWQARRNEKMKCRRRQEKKRKNRISTSDFYSKSLEFKTWLLEAKQLQLDMLLTPKAKSHFKTFVKKWNQRKLPAPYYRGDATLWSDVSVSATPSGTISWVAGEGGAAVTPGVEPGDALLARHSRPPRSASFSTFGKKRGSDSRQLRCRSCFEPTLCIEDGNAASMPAKQLYLDSEQRAKDSAKFGAQSLRQVDHGRPSILRAATFKPPRPIEHRFSCIPAFRNGELSTMAMTDPTAADSCKDITSAVKRGHTTRPNMSRPLYDYSNVMDVRESNV